MSTEDQNKAVVTLHLGVDVDAFIEDMVSGTNHNEFMPNRPVELYNEKSDSLRNVDFVLTLDEVVNLKNDPRVIDVRYGTKAENGIFERVMANDGGKFYSKTYDANTAHHNWALPASSSTTNLFQSSTLTYTHNYNLAGEGVDIVVQDTGIRPDHPEWLNPEGTASRLQQINWPVDSGLTGTYTQGAGYYADVHGHGTHCTSSAAGRLYGWAKKANIYSMKILNEPDSFPSGASFNIIRAWHNNKTVQSTGVKRPTVVSMSWTYYGTYPTTFTRGTYRGVEWTSDIGVFQQQYGMVQTPYNRTTLNNQTRYVFPTRVASVEADMLDCINAGIIMVGAAGNYSHKMDQPTGQDYDNRVSLSFADYYYHRGGTPSSCAGVVNVGAVSLSILNSKEPKTDFSNTGPRVDVWASGDYITSALPSTDCTIATYGYPVFPYPGNSAYVAGKVSGTSQACPQVTGVVACMLESRPYYKQADVLKWVKETGTKSRLYDSTGGYTDYTSLQGSVNNFLYNPASNNTAWTTSGVGTTQRNNSEVPFALSDYNNVLYGNEILQKADIYIPPVTPKGVIVFAHPGGWTLGDKTGIGVADQLDLVRDAGYIIVNCNYRLANSTHNGYGMNLINDIATVIEYLTTDNTGTNYSSIWSMLRYWVNAKGLMVAGGSAGGHIAVMAAGLKLTKPQIKAVVSMAGPMDLEYGVRYTLNADLQGFIDTYTQNSLVLRQDCSPLYRFANYTASAGREPSLYNNLQNSTAQFYFVTNTNDTLVPTNMVQSFVTFLGNRATLQTITDDDPNSPPGAIDHNYYNYTYSQFLIQIAAQVFV